MLRPVSGLVQDCSAHVPACGTCSFRETHVASARLAASAPSASSRLGLPFDFGLPLRFLRVSAPLRWNARHFRPRLRLVMERRFEIGVLALVTLALSLPGQQPAEVRGNVVDARGGEALSNVAIQLV